MCDGYYFPISGSVTQRDFYRDANICRRSCGSDAVLFYHAASSGDASAMVDLTGRAYARLPNAFRYRKQLVDGCKCRPEPWAPSEIARHDRYAVDEANIRQTGISESVDTAAEIAAADHQRSADQAMEAQTNGVDSPRNANEVEPDAPRPSTAAANSTVMQSDGPVQRPTPRKALVHPVGQATRASVQPRSRPTPAPTNPSGFFGLGSPAQPKLRWPGD